MRSQCANLPNRERADSIKKFRCSASTAQPLRQIGPEKALLLQHKINHFLGRGLLISREMSVFV